MRLKRPISEGEVIHWADVELRGGLPDPTAPGDGVKVRQVSHLDRGGRAFHRPQPVTMQLIPGSSAVMSIRFVTATTMSVHRSGMIR